MRQAGGPGVHRLAARHQRTSSVTIGAERLSVDLRGWPRVESNHRAQLRRLPLCPLSYGAREEVSAGGREGGLSPASIDNVRSQSTASKSHGSRDRRAGLRRAKLRRLPLCPLSYGAVRSEGTSELARERLPAPLIGAGRARPRRPIPT